MKAKILLAALLLTASASFSQSQPPTSAASRGIEGPVSQNTLQIQMWNVGIFGDYANGVGTRTGVHAGGATLRLGKRLTDDHGRGWVRGNFEYDVDLTPVEFYHLPSVLQRGATVTTPAKTYYTGGLTPFIAKWNFTNGKRWFPFVAAEGGVVFSTSDLPQGDTAPVNFTSGAAFGVHRISDNGKNAWTFQGKIYHLSNASIGPHNPGVNLAVQFKIGYTWFKW